MKPILGKNCPYTEYTFGRPFIKGFRKIELYNYYRTSIKASTNNESGDDLDEEEPQEDESSEILDLESGHVGEPEFDPNWIEQIKEKVVDQDVLFEQLVALTMTGAENLQLSVTEIRFTHFRDKREEVLQLLDNDRDKNTIHSLLNLGVRFYPALILMSDRTIDHRKLKWAIIMEKDTVQSINKISKFLLCCVLLWTLCDGIEFPERTIDGEKSRYFPPHVAENVGYTDFHEDIERIWSCDPKRLDYKWILQFPFGLLSIKTQNRLSLGIAGYRIMQAFANAQWKNNTPTHVLDLHKKVKRIVKTPTCWSCHPAFRHPQVISQSQSINKMLITMIAIHATDSYKENSTDIQKKSLFVEPKELTSMVAEYDIDFDWLTQDPIDFKAKTTKELKYQFVPNWDNVNDINDILGQKPITEDI